MRLQLEKEIATVKMEHEKIMLAAKSQQTIELAQLQAQLKADGAGRQCSDQSPDPAATA